MKYGLIGEHLGHSYSREIHAQVADYDYELCEVAPEELDSFLRKAEFRAINVTIPYKQSVIPYLSYISPQAESIGAVNTVVNRDGKLWGYNTDFAGMEALIARMGLSLRGKKVLILGTGGTSKTARAVCESAGAREILKVSRRASGEAVSYEQAVSGHGDAEILINTTPVGMYPRCGEAPIDLAHFPRLEGVVDAVYNPLRTRLVQAGQERGVPAEGGLYMLAGQGVCASAIFLEKEFDPALTEGVYRAILGRKQNIVLIGMPSCGKTTVGRLLAERCGRRLIDTDEKIVERLGEPIAAFMARNGEASFRDVEQEVVAGVADESGCVIATGGGAVLRQENLRLLRQNGLLVFLDRPLEKLMPTADRPLSASREALERRYRERYGLYVAAADLVVDASGAIEDEVETIRKEMGI
ncbi:MAG: shikimate kinase [Oscillospiraceae bacterium]|nr:shikimate kinase [Oscillospiraceae bacterium]